MAEMFITPAFFIGLFGLSGATLLCPFVAKVMALRKEHSKDSKHLQTKKIAILIPAHNEGLTLQNTLRSINSSISFCKAEYPYLTVDITVGADGCTDNTTKIGENCRAKIIPSKSREGKWKTILTLIEKHCEYDWIALVDSGTAWPQNLLFKVVPLLSSSKRMAVAPSYKDSKSGKLAACLWWIERKIKQLETASGGPVSTHGATAFYRVGELLQAIDTLRGSEWRNDDVVIPLVLRTLYPDKEIMYCHDISVFESVPERVSFPRRKRVLLGNLEWVKVLFPVVYKQNRIVALLALRRVFRIFWAYWILLLLLPLVVLSLSLPLLCLFLTIGITAILWHSCAARVFANAALISLLAPFYLISEHAFGAGRWR